MQRQLVPSWQSENGQEGTGDQVSPSKACLGNLLSSARHHLAKFLSIPKTVLGTKHLIHSAPHCFFPVCSVSQPPCNPSPNFCASLPLGPPLQGTLTMNGLLPLCPTSPVHTLGRTWPACRECLFSSQGLAHPLFVSSSCQVWWLSNVTIPKDSCTQQYVRSKFWHSSEFIDT